MVPYKTRRWLFAFRASGLNSEPCTSWGWSRASAGERFMNRYYEWCEIRA